MQYGLKIDPTTFTVHTNAPNKKIFLEKEADDCSFGCPDKKCPTGCRNLISKSNYTFHNEKFVRLLFRVQGVYLFR